MGVPCGKIGCFLGCISPVAAMAACGMTCSRVGGDIGGVVGFFNGLLVAGGLWTFCAHLWGFGSNL